MIVPTYCRFVLFVIDSANESRHYHRTIQVTVYTLNYTKYRYSSSHTVNGLKDRSRAVCHTVFVYLHKTAADNKQRFTVLEWHTRSMFCLQQSTPVTPGLTFTSTLVDKTSLKTGHHGQVLTFVYIR